MMEVLKCVPPEDWTGLNLTLVIEPAKTLEKEVNICITNAISTLENGHLIVGVIDLNETEFTLPDGLRVANLHILSLEPAQFIAPLDPNLCRYLVRSYPGETESFLKKLYRGPTEFKSTQKIWFSTP